MNNDSKYIEVRNAYNSLAKNGNHGLTELQILVWNKAEAYLQTKDWFTYIMRSGFPSEHSIRKIGVKAAVQYVIFCTIEGKYDRFTYWQKKNFKPIKEEDIYI